MLNVWASSVYRLVTAALPGSPTVPSALGTVHPDWMPDSTPPTRASLAARTAGAAPRELLGHSPRSAEEHRRPRIRTTAPRQPSNLHRGPQLVIDQIAARSTC